MPPRFAQGIQGSVEMDRSHSRITSGRQREQGQGRAQRIAALAKAPSAVGELLSGEEADTPNDSGRIGHGSRQQTQAYEGAIKRPAVPVAMPAAISILLGLQKTHTLFDRSAIGLGVVEHQRVEQIGDHLAGAIAAEHPSCLSLALVASRARCSRNDPSVEAAIRITVVAEKNLQRRARMLVDGRAVSAAEENLHDLTQIVRISWLVGQIWEVTPAANRRRQSARQQIGGLEVEGRTQGFRPRLDGIGEDVGEQRPLKDIGEVVPWSAVLAMRSAAEKDVARLSEAQPPLSEHDVECVPSKSAPAGGGGWPRPVDTRLRP